MLHGFQVPLLHLRLQLGWIDSTRSVSLYSVSFAWRKMVHVCNAKHQDALLLFMLNVQGETITAWRLNVRIVISHIACSVKSIGRSKLSKKWKSGISKLLKKSRSFARLLINAWILTIAINLNPRNITTKKKKKSKNNLSNKMQRLKKRKFAKKDRLNVRKKKRLRNGVKRTKRCCLKESKRSISSSEKWELMWLELILWES